MKTKYIKIGKNKDNELDYKVKGITFDLSKKEFDELLFTLDTLKERLNELYNYVNDDSIPAFPNEKNK